jgi:hypothetical protein
MANCDSKCSTLIASKLLRSLAQWNWTPVFVSSLPRVNFDGMKPASLYELDLPRERQPVVDDRIYGEMADKRKKSAEDIWRRLGIRR